MRSDKALWGAIAILTLAVFCLGGYLFISSRSYEIEIESDKAPTIPLLRLAEFSVAGCKVNEVLSKNVKDWAWVHDKAITAYCLEEVRLNLMRVLTDVKRPAVEEGSMKLEELAEEYGGVAVETGWDERDVVRERRVALVNGRLDADLYRKIDLKSIAACQYTLMRETEVLETSLYIRDEAEKFCLEVFWLRHMVFAPKWQTDPSYYLNKNLEFELFD